MTSVLRCYSLMESEECSTPNAVSVEVKCSFCRQLHCNSEKEGKNCSQFTGMTVNVVWTVVVVYSIGIKFDFSHLG